MCKRSRIFVLALTGLLLAAGTVEAGKKNKKVPAPAAPPAAPAAPAGPSAWEAYESGVALVTLGQLEEGVAELEQAASGISDPIVWCYSRLYLADAYFQQGNAAEDDAARDAKFAAARERFRQASFCVGAELPAEGDPNRPSAEEIAVMKEFQSFGADDLAAQLETVSGKQGELLTVGEDHEAVADHWRLVAEVSGATRQTQYQIALACLEGNDLECAGTEALAASRMSGSDPAEPVGEIATRVIERAGQSDGEEADRYWKFVFRLLSDWQKQDPFEDRPAQILQQTLTSLQADERLRLLALAEDCWVPLQFAEDLRERNEEFLDEALVAYRCDPDGPAKNLLIDTYYGRAKDAWNGLSQMTAEEFSDPAKVRSHLREIEPALRNLEKVLELEEYPRAAELKAKITAYVDKMKVQRSSLAEEAAAETAAYCKQQWNSFRWWSDRRYEMLSQTPPRADFEEFRRSCKSYVESKGLAKNLAELDEDIDEALALRSCQETWQRLRKQPDAESLKEFEASCQQYVELYEVAEPLQQVKNSLGG